MTKDSKSEDICRPLFEKDDEWKEQVSPLLGDVSGLGVKHRVECPANVMGYEALLRILLHYIGFSRSSRVSAAWGVGLGLASALSHVWLLTCLRRSGAWLRALSMTMLARLCVLAPPPESHRGWVLYAADATCAHSEQAPNSKAFERIHLLWDVSYGFIRQIWCPLRRKAAETLTHFTLEEKMLVLLDRHYCSGVNFAYSSAVGAALITRYKRSVNLYREMDGKAVWELESLLSELKEDGQCLERTVYLNVHLAKKTLPKHWRRTLRGHSKRIAVRLLVKRLGDEFAQRELARMKANKQDINDETRLIAPFIVLITNLDEQDFSTHEVLELYPLRWTTTEINIRESKSGLGMSRVVGKRVATRRAWIWGHILGQLLNQLVLATAFPQRPQEATHTRGISARTLVRAQLKAVVHKALEQALTPLRISWLHRFIPAFIKALPSKNRVRDKPRSHEAYLAKVIPDFDPDLWRAWIFDT